MWKFFLGHSLVSKIVKLKYKDSQCRHKNVSKMAAQFKLIEGMELKITVPDRSNLTGNALLERKWNAAGTPKERQNFCGVGARSKQERVLLRTR